MNITFKPEALKQFEWWLKKDKRVAKKIANLVKDIENNPTIGIGKPEMLKHNLSGLWSRRITKEHRLIYKVKEFEVTIISCRYHYD